MPAKKKYIQKLNGNISEMKMHYKARMAEKMYNIDVNVKRDVLKLVDDLVEDIYKHTLHVIDEISRDYDVFYGDD
ncbi:MAG: hypothetical protein ACXQTD_03445 [Candidatus Syntropharchaeia archaeon]